MVTITETTSATALLTVDVVKTEIILSITMTALKNAKNCMILFKLIKHNKKNNVVNAIIIFFVELTPV